MSDERDFLHKISNSLATAKISLEIALEMAEDPSNGNKELAQMLKSTFTALTELTEAIAKRRLELA